MGIVEKLGFWRGVGSILNTRAGTSLMEASRGLVNFSTRILPGPRIDGPPPLNRLRKPLPECRVTVVATAGLFVHGDQPFDIDNPQGDPSFREIPADVAAQDLRIAHTHYTHRWWEQDPEVIFPLARLRELEAAGIFTLAPRFFSFGFGGILTREYIDQKTGTAHALARRLIDDEVDLALLVPA